MAEVFYRKWRPRTLAEVVGQEPVTRTLLNALATGRVAHAYLFFGPRGTGKTSTGRILAKAANCLQIKTGEPCNECASCRAFNEGRAVDLIEIDAASNTGVDDIRELKERVNFAPNSAKYKVYIIDEVHMLSTSAFNALLKTLEEPPEHVIFVLATTEVHKVPPTITSRCQRFDLRRIPLNDMIKRLEHIAGAEGITAEPEALALIARSATGSLRDAENLLEQMVAYHGPNINLEDVRSELGLTGDARIKDLTGAILSRDISGGMAIINNAAADGLDLRQFNRELTDILRNMMLIKAGAADTLELTPEEIEEMKAAGADVSLEEISRAIKLFARADFRFSPQSTLPLELALVDFSSPSEKASKAEPGPKTTTPPKKAKTQAPVKSAASQSQEPIATPPVPEPEPVRRISKPEGLSDIEHIKQHWPEFLKACKGTIGNIDALLRNACEPVAVEGTTLKLGFYAKSGFQKGKVEDSRITSALADKLEEVFGTRYTVDCITIGEENRQAPPPLSESPLVKEAMAHGARIINEEYIR
ncbi:MAG: DNA polymerase III subunit gamma/tau [Dehalococcoidia bacterium]